MRMQEWSSFLLMSNVAKLRLDGIFCEELNQDRYSVATANTLNWINGFVFWGLFLHVCKLVDFIVKCLQKRETESICGYTLSFLSIMTYALPNMIIAIVVVKVDFDYRMMISMFSVFYDIIVNFKQIYTKCISNEYENYNTFTEQYSYTNIDFEFLDKVVNLTLYLYYTFTLIYIQKLDAFPFVFIIWMNNRVYRYVDDK